VDLRDYMRLVRKRWRIISACVLLGLLGAAALTALSPKSYSAQAQVFVSAQATADDLTSALQGSGYTQQRVKSYADIVDTPLVTDPVVKQLNLGISSEELARKISASNPLDTLLLNISVTDNDPEQAAKMANAVAAQFSTVVRQLETPDTSTQAPGTPPQALVKATVVKPANVPTVPVSPRPKINLALGLLVGLALGIGLAVLRESLDTSIKSVEDLQNVMNTPVLGIIPEDQDARANPLISAEQGNHPGGVPAGAHQPAVHRRGALGEVGRDHVRHPRRGQVHDGVQPGDRLRAHRGPGAACRGRPAPPADSGLPRH